MRRNTKLALKSFLEVVPGVKRVFEGEPKEVGERDMPAVVISLPNSNENRATTTLGAGKKKIESVATLTIMMIDSSNNAVAGELAFDDLLDAIDAAFRANPTLDPSGWPVAGTKFIRTDVAKARLAGKDGGNVFRLATKEIDILDFATG